MNKKEKVLKDFFSEIGCSDIDKFWDEIDCEYNRIMDYEVMQKARVLKFYFRNAYQAFKDSPGDWIGVDQLFWRKGVQITPESQRKNRATGPIYAGRIWDNILYSYYYGGPGENSDFRFRVKCKSGNEEAGEKFGPEFRLQLKYKKDQNVAELLRRYSKIISGDSPFSDPNLIRYLEQVEWQHKNIKTGYLGGILPSLEIDKMYLQLNATKNPSFTRAIPLSNYQEFLSGIGTEVNHKTVPVSGKFSTAILVETILKDLVSGSRMGSKHLVFLGSGGSGKSTMIRYLAYNIASGQGAKFGLEGYLPIFVDLSEYDRNAVQNIVDFAIEESASHILPPEDRKKVVEGLWNFMKDEEKNRAGSHMVFLLGGLDETRINRSRVVKQIQSLSKNFEQSLIIVTSRQPGYYETILTDFTPYPIDRLNKKQAVPFIQKWFENLEKSVRMDQRNRRLSDWAARRSNYLIGEIDRSASLRRLISSPLYLTFLCFLASDQDRKVLPQTRSKLYREFFRQIIFEVEKKHDGTLPYKGEEFLRGFNEICWIIHKSVHGDIENIPTEDFLREFLDNVSSSNREKSLRDFSSSDWENILNFWIRSGVLFLAKTRNEDDLVLSQLRNFLEYGFASRLATFWDKLGKKEHVGKALEANFNNANLYEALLLFVDQIKDPGIFLCRIWENKIASNKDDIFNRSLILLAELIHEVKEKLRKTNLVSDMVNKLREIVKAESELTLPIRADVIKHIALLGGFDALEELFEEETPKKILIEVAAAFRHVEDAYPISSIQELYNNESDLYVKAILSMMITRAKDDQVPQTSEGSMEDDGPSDEIEAMVQDLSGQALSNAVTKLFAEQAVPGARQALARILGNKAGKAIIPCLEEVYKKENDPEVKMVLAAVIGELGEHQTAFHLLQELFENSESNIHKLHLAVSMARLEYKESEIEHLENRYKEPAIEHLEQLLREEDQYIRRRVITSICHIGDKTHLSLYKRLFGVEEDINVNMLIARMIGLSGEKDYAIGLLKELLKKKNPPHVELHLASLIGDMGDKKTAIKKLEGLLDKEKDPGIRRLCILAIRYLSDETTISYLKEIFDELCGNEKNIDNKMLIGRILGDLGEKEAAIDFLNKLLEEVDDDHMKLHLASAIGDIGDKESAFEIFESLLDKEEDPHMKLHIVSSIGHLADADDIGRLKKQYDKQTDVPLKRSLAIAIYRIAQQERLLIFEGEDGEIEIEKIPERYSLGI